MQEEPLFTVGNEWVRNNWNVHVLKLSPKEITEDMCPKLKAQFGAYVKTMEAPDRLVLDMTNVTYLSSPAINELMRLQTALTEGKLGKLIISNRKPDVNDFMERAHLDKRCTFFEGTVDEAVVAARDGRSPR